MIFCLRSLAQIEFLNPRDNFYLCAQIELSQQQSENWNILSKSNSVIKELYHTNLQLLVILEDKINLTVVLSAQGRWFCPGVHVDRS